MPTRASRKPNPRPRRGDSKARRRKDAARTEPNPALMACKIARELCGFRNRSSMCSKSRHPDTIARRRVAIWLAIDPEAQTDAGQPDVSLRRVASAMGLSSSVPSKVAGSLVPHSKLEAGLRSHKLREDYRRALKAGGLSTADVKPLTTVAIRIIYTELQMHGRIHNG